ncbi:MAG TPA: leukotoxin LktA family filamentous adhesin [Candidatus Aphodousia faecavium]|nr:leukotoxin LktA family filamentous adhesin [Candidatus Aphodousia faecavium]
MNKVYKVLWNRVRACHVVTDEAKKRRTKGKAKSIVELIAPAALTGALTAGLALAPPAIAAPVTQTNIQADSAWSHTHINTNGNVHTITTDYAKDNIGINKFEHFELKAQHIANLKFKDGTNDLVNFVNNEIKVDGTVNAIKGNQIGGNLMFVSASGMTVGSTGVINAGSFTAITPDQKTYDELSKIDNDAMTNMSTAQYQKLRQAQVPINPNAIITISGSIHAGNQVTLASGKVHVNKGAVVQSGVTDFSQLVNIREGQTLITSSGITEGAFTLSQEAGSGDVLLLARADTSAVSSADQNPTITAEVKVDGQVKSRENLKVKALAGNGTYDVEGELADEEDGGQFLVTGNHNLASINAKVTVTGTLEAQKDLTVDATAENRIDNSGGIRTAQGLSLEILGSVTAINEAVAYANLNTSADVTVSNTAKLTSTGGDLSVTADADTRLEIGTATSKIQLIDFLNNQTASKVIPSVAAVVGLMDSHATVNISGDLTSAGDLTIQSTNNLDASLTATSSTMNSDHIQTAFTVGQFTGDSTVIVDQDATVTMTGASGTYDYTVRALQTNTVETTASAAAGRNSYGGLAFNYTELNTASDLTLETGLTGVAKNVVIQSDNNTQSFNVTSDNAANLSGMMDKVTSYVSSLSTNFLNTLLDKSWNSINSSYQSPSARVGGAVAVVKGSQTSDLTLNPAASSVSSITAQEGMDISSRAQIWDHHFIANSSVRNEADESENRSKLQGSLALLVELAGNAEHTVESDLTIGDGANLTVNAGNLNVTNEAIIAYNRIEAMKNAFNDAIADLEAIYRSHDGEDSAFDQQWKKVQEQAALMNEAFEKVSADDMSFSDQLSQLGTALGEFASTAGEFLSLAQPLAQTGISLVDLGMSLFAFVQPTNYVNTSVSASGSGAEGSWDAAGSFAILLQDTASTLTIGKNVHLTAHNQGQAPESGLFGAVTIAGRSLNESAALAGHIRSLAGITIPVTTEASSIGGTVLYQSLETDNKVYVREGAVIDGDDVSGIYATDGIFSIPIAASADITKGGFGLDALVSISDIDANNALYFDDEAQVSAPSIVLDAARDDDIQTIAGAIDVGYGEGASIGGAAGFALNLGSLTNTLTIADNDTYLNGTSIATITDGGLYSDNGQDDSIILSADTDLAMNAIGAALVAEMSGTSDPEPPADPNSKIEIIKNFFKGIGDKVSQYGDKAQGKISTLADKLETQSAQLASGIRDKLFNTQDQNNSTSNTMAGNGQTNDQRFGSNGANGQASNTAGITSQNSAANSSEASHFQMGFAGSIAWNDLDSDNGVTIDVDNFTINSPEIDINAVTDKWVGAWAGSAAINFVKKNNSVNNALGIAGAIAGNTGSYSTTINIDGNQTNGNPGLVFGSYTKEADIYAINDGTLVAEGLAVAVSAGNSQSNWAFDGNVSVNWLDTETTATVSGLTWSQNFFNDTHYDQAAWSGETQVTGGTGFGLTTASNNRNATLGLIFAVADLDNTVSSTLSHSMLSGLNTVDVRALSSLTQVTTAVSAQIALGNSALSFSGAAASSDLDNTISAGLSDSTITLKGDNARLQVAARDSNDQENAAFDAVTEENWYPDATDELTNTQFYQEVGLITKKDANNNPVASDPTRVSDFLDDSNMLQTTVVASFGIAPEDNSGAAGVLVNRIDNDFSTNSSNVTVTTDGSATNAQYLQSSEANVVSVGVAAGAAGNGGSGNIVHFGAAGSVVVSNVTQNATATSNNLSTTLNDTTLQAGNSAVTVNVAGNVGVSVGGDSNVALGGSVVVMNTNNGADIDANNLKVNDGSLTMTAQNEADAWAASADGAISSSMSFGGAVAVNRVQNTASIALNNATLKNTSSARLHAKDDSALWTLAGNVTVGAGDKGAGVSGAVAYSISGREDSPGTAVSVNGITVTNETAAGEADISTDIDVKAEATDHVSTLVVSAGISTGTVGFAGAAGVNDIKRKVSATVNNLVGRDLRDVSIEAFEDADIDNLSLTAAYGTTAGVGLGIAVNRIDNETRAALTADQKSTAKEAPQFEANSLSVKAHTDNDIDTIGIGGAGGQTGAGAGSVAINLITSDTRAELANISGNVDAYGIVNAQSDDTIGAYTGNASGSTSYAAALSVTVNEKKGTTSATVTNSDLTHTGNSTETGTVNKGVADSVINDGIVGDIDVGASLVGDRAEQRVSGLSIGATSTETYKTFVINGSGSVTGAGAGTVSVTYHGGDTTTTVSGSNLSAKGDVDIFSGDYVNIDTVSTTVAGAQTAAVPISVNVMTTEHETQTSVTGGALSVADGQTISVTSEAKEGVSGLAINGGGAMTAAVGALVNVTRQLSDVSTTVTNVSSITGTNYTQTTDYLGRLTTMGLNAAGALNAAAAVSVSVNYADNDLNNDLTGSTLSLNGALDMAAHRRSDWGFVDVNVTGAQYGAVSTYVAVNTIEGTTDSDFDRNTVNALDGTAPDVSIQAGNTERYDATEVNVSGGMYGTMAANVIVNRYYGDANLNVNASTISADDLNFRAYQDRFINETSVTASGSLGTIGANVIATFVGDYVEPGETPESFWDTEDLRGIGAIVGDYVNTYGSSSTVTNPGVLGSILTQGDEYLTDENKASIVGAAATAAQAADTASGTTLTVNNTIINANTVSMTAEEDTAEGAGVDMTVGSGQAGAAALAASVATLRLNHNASVQVASSNITTQEGGTIGAKIDGDHTLTVWQVSGTLASGTAAYADAAINGQAQVTVNQGSLTTAQGDKTLEIISRNDSTNTLDANGIIVSGISGGGIVTDLRDTSDVLIDLVGLAAYGNLTVEAIRAQHLTADSMAGQGGLANGVGALADITDSGSVRVTINDIRHDKVTSGSASDDDKEAVLAVKANDATQSYVKAYGAQASALGIGFVEATLNKSGSTDVVLSGNTFANDSVNVVAAGGIDSTDESEAMKLTAITEGYGGAVIGSLFYNQASVNNTHSVNLTVNNGHYADSDSLNLQALGHVVYDVRADAGSGGVLAMGNNLASVTHAVNVSATLDNLGKAQELTVNAVNSEEATVTSESAGGGVILIEGAGNGISPAYTQHTNSAQTTVTVKGNLETQDDLFLGAETVIDAKFKADNTQGGVAGGSGANLVNNNTTVTKVIFDKASSVTSGGKLTAKALTTSSLSSADGYYAVDSGVYGGFMGSEIRLQNTENNTNEVLFSDGASAQSGDDMVLEAKLRRTTDLRTRARTAGVVNGATAYNTHLITSQNAVVLTDASVSVTGREKTLTMASSAEENIHAEAIGDLQGGLAGGAGAHVNLTLNRDNHVTIDKTSEVYSSGNLQLFAGRDAAGKNASLTLTAYAHAYGKGLISGTDVALSDPMTLHNNVNVEGEAKARNDIEVVAFSGDVVTTEMARYYHWSTTDDAAETFEIASTATGTKSGNLTEDNAVTVNGKLLAGFATASDITISGVYLPDDEGFTTDHPFSVTQKGEEATIEFGTEDLANVYWSRHEEIQRLLAEYGANGKNEDRQMMVALKAEDAYLLQTMRDKGFLVTKDGREQFVGSQQRGYITIKDLTVSGGNIAFTTDSVKGGSGGVIEAHSAEHINIDNRSNLALHLENVYIAEKGGTVTLNDQTMSQPAGFTGILHSESDSPAPTMSIKSHYSGPENVQYKQNGEVKDFNVKADTSVTVNGILGNRAGDFTMDVTGDIALASDATVTAAGRVQMGATGAVTQSYTDGIFNVSGEGSVEELWKDQVASTTDEWIKEFVGSEGETKTNTWTDNSDKFNTGAIVAGGDIFIAGETINLNGTVQSGFAEYGLTIGEGELNQRIESIKQAWQNAGSPEAFDVKTSTYQIVEGGYELNDQGQYVWKVGAWYDPLNDRVVIDDITPQGGHIYLTGKIANTGGGKLIVADGHATVSVDAGNHDLLTGNIDTGNLAGSITITDTAWYEEGTYDAKVTEYTKDKDGNLITKTHFLDTDGKEIDASQSSGWSAYSPKDGLLYAWSEGYGTTTVVTKSDSEDFYLWGAIDTNPDNWETTKTDVKEDESLSSAGTVGILTRPSQGSSEFVAWGDYKDLTQSGWTTHTWTEYHDFLHFSGTAHGEATQTTTQNYLLTFTVKADKDVGVESITGNNSISLTSGKSVLLGGSVRADEGKVTIDAGDSILNHSGFAGIYGASDITLSAGTGSIGTESSAIRIEDSSDLKLNATAGADIFIDATGVSPEGTITSGELSAKGTLSLNTAANLNAQNVSGTDITLNGSGNITIGNVHQYVNLDHTQRLDIRANNVTIDGSTTDLSIGLIEADNSVKITTDHALLDAQDRSATDSANAEQKIDAWKQAGLINADGTDSAQNRYEADLNAAKTEIAHQLELYYGYLNATDAEKQKMTAAQKSFYESIVARFEGYVPSDGKKLTVVDVVAKDMTDSTTAIGQIEAAYKAGDYGWSQNELLFAIADSIINPDPGATPQAGSANIIAQNINIKSQAVGASDGVLTGSFADFDVNTAEGLKLYEALSRADVGDVVWDFENGTVSIQTKRPIIVEQTGSNPVINIEAPEHIFVQSTDDSALRIGQIISNGAVRLVSAQGITGVEGNLVQGSTITLRGGVGGIGSAYQWINLNQTAGGLATLSETSGGWTALSASGGIYVNSNGSLSLYSVASNTGLYLAAAGVTSYSGEADEEEEFDVNSLGYINAPVIDLTIKNGADVGTADHALRVNTEGSQPVELTIKSNDSSKPVGNVYVQTVNDGTLQLAGFTSNGEVSVAADGLSVTGALSAKDDVTLTSTADMTLEAVTSLNGKVSATSQGALTATEALTANSDIKLESAGNMAIATVSSKGGSVSAKALGALSVADQSELSAQNGTFTLDGAPVQLGESITVKVQGLQLQTNDDLLLKGSTITVGDSGLSLTSGGKLTVDNSALTSQGDTTLSGDRGVTLNQSTLATSGDGLLTLYSKYGDLTVSGLTNKELLGSGIVMRAAGLIDVSGLALKSGSILELSGAHLNLEQTSFSSLTGAALADDLMLKAQSGGLDLTQTHGFAAQSILISAAGDIRFADGESVTAQGTLDVQSSGGRIVLTNGTLQAADLIRLAALGGALDLTGTNTEDGVMRLSSGELELRAAGDLLVGDTTVNWQATSGNLIVDVGSIDWAQDSVLQAQKVLSVNAEKRLAIGNNLTAEGSSVSITGGAEHFTLGTGATLTATDGAINVLASHDATMGGELTVNATAQSPEASADITIGAEGIFSVTDNAFEVTSDHGQVTIYGGQGMFIMDDLTVITPLHANLSTGSGDLTIGNRAVVKAGSASGLLENTYGVVNITAGENFAIGDWATIYADDLNITAQAGDITFGDKADLWGVTGGVSIVAENGSIHMGENLVVHSEAELTEFKALSGDIVIERAGTLQSSANGIVFEAAGDVVFKDDFLASGTSFVIDAEGAVDVRDNAYVHTFFGSQPGVGNETTISGAQGIRFGDNARFDTTTLILNAGDSVTGTVGDLVLGDNAEVSTTYTGIVVDATGDVTFGENAVLKTSLDNIDHDISLSAAGSLYMGSGAVIEGMNRVFVVANDGITLGERASIANSAVDNRDSVTFVQSTAGDVALGADAVISGQNVFIWAANEEGTCGGSVILGDNSRIEVDSQTGTFELRAYDSAIVENRFTVESQDLVTIETVTGDILLGDKAAFVTAGDLTLSAGRNIALGDDSMIVTSLDGDSMGHHDVRMSAADSITFGDNTQMQGDASIYLTALEGDVTFGKNAHVGVEGRTDENNGIFEISALGGSVSIDDGSNIYGERRMNIAAGGDITLTGNVWLDSDTYVGLTSQAGDILMQKDVWLGGYDELTGVATSEIVLSAAGSIRQLEANSEMGMAAQYLSVTAGDEVQLGVLADKGGNQVARADINAAGSIILGFAQTDTELSVNRDRGGEVAGDFILVGDNNRIDLASDSINATGNVSIVVNNLVGVQNLQAAGDLQLVLRGADEFAAESLKGHYVGLVSKIGALSIGSIESDQSVDLLRTDTQRASHVTVSDIRAGDRVFVVNGAGGVNLDQVLADSEIWVFAQSEGDIVKGNWTSVNSQASRFSGAQKLLHYLTQSGAFDDASDLIGNRLIPELHFGMQDLTRASTRVDHSVIDEHFDLLNPLGRYFFLHRRAENVDESGLPTRQDPIIRDYWSESFQEATTLSAVSR